MGRPGRWRREPATAAQLKALEGMARFLRWWRGPEAAKKRIRGWIKGGLLTRKGEVSDVLGLLRWLADWSLTAREAGMREGWAKAAAVYQWPEVALPEAVPSLESAG